MTDSETKMSWCILLYISFITKMMRETGKELKWKLTEQPISTRPPHFFFYNHKICLSSIEIFFCTGTKTTLYKTLSALSTYQKKHTFMVIHNYVLANWCLIHMNLYIHTCLYDLLTPHWQLSLQKSLQAKYFSKNFHTNHTVQIHTKLLSH